MEALMCVNNITIIVGCKHLALSRVAIVSTAGPEGRVFVVMTLFILLKNVRGAHLETSRCNDDTKSFNWKVFLEVPSLCIRRRECFNG